MEQGGNHPQFLAVFVLSLKTCHAAVTASASTTGTFFSCCRLHPVKPMNAMANKPQSKSLNVISTMNEKLLEMSVKVWSCPSFDLIEEFVYSLGHELPFGQPPSMGTVLKFLFSCRLICNRAGARVLWWRFSGTASSLEHSRALRGALSIVLASKDTSRLEAQLTLIQKAGSLPGQQGKSQVPLLSVRAFLGNREVKTGITAVPPSGVRGQDLS